jgi:ubiquinone/menaquinone biosynthesis C-methylase UbiE
VLDAPRRAAIDALRLAPGQRVLVVGGGTGLDLPHVPPGVATLLTDLTPAMLARARDRATARTLIAQMDGHCLGVADRSVDAVLLHLVLAVIPDPVACLRECHRVLRPGGTASVLDKFLPDDARPSLARRALNAVTSVLATDINRKLGDILRDAATTFRLVSDEPAALGGVFRRVQLRKPS